ncbi:MAG: phosphopantothenate/pantothenate synthetase, partial [Candidatus Hodarchaeales archaeon]
PKDHPRYASLVVRETIIEGMHKKVVAEAGLIAHGRGEAFDYLLGEKTPDFALEQEELAVLTMLKAKHPVISVNGNVAILCPKEIVELGKVLNAPLEINLFYRSREREKAIKTELESVGAKNILGIDPEYHDTIPELSHSRRIVDSRGIAISDCVFVPLEDGDRTQALRKLGKTVVTVDLNPLSRTSITANVSITNNIVRAVPEMVQLVLKNKDKEPSEIDVKIKQYDNSLLLQKALRFMSDRLLQLSKQDSFHEKNEVNK